VNIDDRRMRIDASDREFTVVLFPAYLGYCSISFDYAIWSGGLREKNAEYHDFE
jgi:hypothetical protein